jgi:predicted PhzF superfamily epimerase YddE/YHI9
MKSTFHIIDVFSSTPFGGNQAAFLANEVLGHILRVEKAVFAKH